MRRQHRRHQEHEFVFVHRPHGPPGPMPEFPHGVKMMFKKRHHHEPWKLLHVREDDENLTLLFSLPGIQRESLKIRAKPDFLKITALLREDLQEYVDQEKIDLRIPLEIDVDPKSASASYVDGILEVQFLVIPPGDEIPLSE